MAELLVVKGPVRQPDGTFLFAVVAKGTQSPVYDDIVATATNDASLISAVKALEARRHRAGVHCWCDYDKPAPAKFLTVL